MASTGEFDDKDDVILNLLAEDSTHASTLLYHHYYRTVFHYVNDIVEDQEQSKDIVQELFLAIWVKRHSLHFSKPLLAYLFVAAHNKAINHIRDVERKTKTFGDNVSLSEIERIPSSAIVDLEAVELASLIKKAMRLLPVKARKTLLMSRKHGMTNAEIATRLKVSQKAVEKNMTKALALLRKYLKPYFKVLLIFIDY
ncbi:RNA polymerase sigma-70 factor [Chryseolinea lacunae]|uniref:RNA polymerase sigma-70 factor n=1 Tax=Chryseolinea lacunae TaxID=2801331 RepID=A0ABS1L2U3_9BACT|nr:RNA polymerase sigma-70 factor [Chryseolinea lacunae]MBL0745812.1 RNA polymerase sigma-70 factor [Chryseolinea lacunae]